VDWPEFPSGPPSRVNSSAKACRRTRENPWEARPDQIKGYANEAAGKVKQGVGKAIGNTTGCVQKALRSEAKGDAQKAVGNAKGAIKDVADKAHRKL
jgi:uncharacterized protein YjbJ (UPF0337 family)